MAIRMTTVVPYPPGLGRLRVRVQNVGEAFTKAVYLDAIENAPLAEGDLVASIRKTWNHINLRGRVYVGTDHWRFPEYGAKPHPIDPRYKNALFWFPKKNSYGLTHPINRVTKHPGNLPEPYMRPAIWKKRTAVITPSGRVAVTS